MIKDAQIRKLMKHGLVTPNVLSPESRGWGRGSKTLTLAAAPVRAMVQAVIDAVADHRYLREAFVIVFMETGLRPDSDGRLRYGQASRPRPEMVAAMPEGSEAPDFVVKLNADRWGELTARQQFALVDHELSHCTVLVGATHVKEETLREYVAELGDDHLGTRDDLKDEQDRPLVRYYKRDDAERPMWHIKHHQIEEFVGVAQRWGKWMTVHERLYDVLDAADDPIELTIGQDKH